MRAPSHWFLEGRERSCRKYYTRDLDSFRSMVLVDDFGLPVGHDIDKPILLSIYVEADVKYLFYEDMSGNSHE